MSKIKASLVDNAELIAIKIGLFEAWKRRYPRIMVGIDSANDADWLNGQRAMESSFLWPYFGFESSYAHAV